MVFLFIDTENNMILEITISFSSERKKHIHISLSNMIFSNNLINKKLNKYEIRGYGGKRTTYFSISNQSLDDFSVLYYISNPQKVNPIPLFSAHKKAR